MISPCKHTLAPGGAKALLYRGATRGRPAPGSRRYGTPESTRYSETLPADTLPTLCQPTRCRSRNGATIASNSQGRQGASARSPTTAPARGPCASASRLAIASLQRRQRARPQERVLASACNERTSRNIDLDLPDPLRSPLRKSTSCAAQRRRTSPNFRRTKPIAARIPPRTACAASATRRVTNHNATANNAPSIQ